MPLAIKSSGATNARCHRGHILATVPVTLACLIFIVSACNSASRTSQSAPDPPATTTTAAPVRHDLEPLTKRFPEIGKPVSATWMGGALGVQSDSRATVPGPSDYWIEAIIELEPATADALRAKYVPTPTGEVPKLKEVLQKDVPAGPFLTSVAMDKALSNNDWRSTTYLDSRSNTLVMRSVDD